MRTKRAANFRQRADVANCSQVPTNYSPAVRIEVNRCIGELRESSWLPVCFGGCVGPRHHPAGQGGAAAPNPRPLALRLGQVALRCGGGHHYRNETIAGECLLREVRHGKILDKKAYQFFREHRRIPQEFGGAARAAPGSSWQRARKMVPEDPAEGSGKSVASTRRSLRQRVAAEVAWLSSPSLRRRDFSATATTSRFFPALSVTAEPTRPR